MSDQAHRKRMWRGRRPVILLLFSIFLMACALSQTATPTSVNTPVHRTLPTALPIPTASSIPQVIPTSNSKFIPAPAFAGTLYQACNGQPISGAAQYDSGHTPHPIAIFSPNGGWHAWNTDLPDGWQAKNLDTTEIVGCIPSLEPVEIESCFYGMLNGEDRFIVRYRSITEVRLVAAQTGRTIGILSVAGELPPDCPSVASFSYFHGEKIVPSYGGEISLEEIAARLEMIVMRDSIYDSGSLVRILNSDPVSALIFSPDGRTLMVLSNTRKSTIALWDVESGQIAHRLAEGSPDAPAAPYWRQAAVSPDGTLLAANRWDNSMVLWDLSTYRQSDEYSHLERVYDLAFSPDGMLLAAGSCKGDRCSGMEASKYIYAPSQILLWDIKDRTLANYRSFQDGQHTDAAFSVAFNPQSDSLVAGTIQGLILLWNSPYTDTDDTLSGHDEPVSSLVFSQDGRTLISAGTETEALLPAGLESETVNPQVIVWDMQTRQILRSFGIGLPERMQGKAVLSPDANFVAYNICLDETREQSCIQSAVAVWDTLTGTPVGPPILTGYGQVTSIVFSPDSRMLAAGTEGGKIILWDFNSAE